MRKVSITAVVLMLSSVPACQKDRGATDDALSQDLKAASSSNDLSLVPNGQAQQIVSPIERSPEARTEHSTTRTLARTSLHTPKTPRLTLTPTAPPMLPAPAPVLTAPAVPAPVAVAAPAPAYHPSSDGSVDDGSSDAGRAPGRGWGVVVRGGVVDGDHCDPRGGGHGMAPPISINNPMPGIHGRF